ncbi:CynX/NimT family MFS transporter [Methylobacterium nodulans]|uniref:Major facilitator superfamily MFS_1 n=1 Tax=Methylobacterium nodulans (strain LMG 21967 / CNCM I-2342 / ORS 2060) TaxID=460265 RepID=B8IU49_METNO|nr:MFS transporter [Methylobacterium nodulans]ACL55094.1 major facilitator superfamily MFS_1 [Methylobacterium nodulans ORS 2060]
MQTIRESRPRDGRENEAGREAARLRRPLWIALGLMLIAFNLRPALSSVGPLLARIREDTGMSGALAGALITLPVLCLGVFGRLGPPVTRRLGPDAGVLAFLIVIAAGLVLRGFGGLPALFAGSVLAAGGIGVVGVILPGIVKRDFPERPGLMMGLYTAVLCLGAAAGAGLTVPAGRLLESGWQGPMMIWALPVLLAALAWLPFVRAAPASPGLGPRRFAALWRDRLAWQVTGFMGLQSSLAYIVFGWLPAALTDRGFDPLAAGLVASLSAMAQTVLALLVPTLAGRSRDQRPWVLLVVGLAVGGFCGLLVGPIGLVWPFALMLGLGLGGCFGLALTLIVLRSPDAQTAGDLSAMAQGVGYTLAALGPLLIGLAHDASDGWGIPAALYGGLGLAAATLGLLAARNRHVLAR